VLCLAITCLLELVMYSGREVNFFMLWLSTTARAVQPQLQRHISIDLRRLQIPTVSVVFILYLRLRNQLAEHLHRCKPLRMQACILMP
jgi:hypothetical protein